MALRNELLAAFEADDRFHVTQPQNIEVGRGGANLPAVFIRWGGRHQAGAGRGHRPVVQVFVVFSPEQVDDPWKDADFWVDEAVDVIYTVDNAFPEILPTLSTSIDPQKTVTARQGSQGAKTFAAAIIQVVGI